MFDQLVVVDEECNPYVRENDFINPGYKSFGWIYYPDEADKTNSTLILGRINYYNISETVPLGEFTLYVNWVPVTYQIKCDLDGGALPEGKTNDQSYTVESEDITLTNPAKPHYIFVGWRNEDTGKLLPVDYTIPKGSTGNINLKAVWEINSYSIDIISDLDKGVIGSYIYIEYGESLPIAGSVKNVLSGLPGYELSGWRNNKTADIVSCAADTASIKVSDVIDVTGETDNIKLYLIFEPKQYTITYKGLEGASLTTANPVTYNVESADITLSNPAKPFYSFIGWSEGTTKASENFVISKGTTGDKVVTANWEGKNYSFELDMNDDSGKILATVSAKYDSRLELDKYKPARADHTFIGWGLSKDDTAPVYTYNMTGIEVSKLVKTDVNTPVRLYALWNEGEKNYDIDDSVEITEEGFIAEKNDEPKGSVFRELRAKTGKCTANSITIKWSKIKGADGYIVYGGRCNSKGVKYKTKKLKEINDPKKVSFTHKKLLKSTFYKYYVKAYKKVGGKKKILSVSKTVHAVTLNSKTGVATSLKVNKTKVTLKKKKSFKIVAK